LKTLDDKGLQFFVGGTGTGGRESDRAGGNLSGKATNYQKRYKKFLR